MVPTENEKPEKMMGRYEITQPFIYISARPLMPQKTLICMSFF